MSIEDELRAYKSFLDAVEVHLDRNIIPGVAEAKRQKAAGDKLLSALRADVEGVDARYKELRAYVSNLKEAATRTAMLRKLDKFYTGGVGNFKEIAASLYDGFSSAAVFKKNGARDYREFHKTHKTLVKLSAALSSDARLRKLCSVKANEAITAYHDAAVIGSAVFKARYYISGSMLNQGSMGFTLKSFNAKFENAWEVLEVARDLGAPDERLAAYEDKISTLEGDFEALEQRRSAISMRSDQVQEIMPYIDDSADWQKIEPILQRLGATLRRTGSAMSDADKAALYRDTVALQKRKPRVTPKLTPGVMVPKNAALREAVEAGPSNPPVDDEAAWREAGSWFMFTAPGFQADLGAFERYIATDHFKDFQDHNSDGVALPIFNSWIQPATRAIASFRPRLQSAVDHYTAREDIDAFQAARGEVVASRDGLLAALREVSARFASERNPFDKNDYESEHREWALNNQIIHQKLEAQISELARDLGGL